MNGDGYLSRQSETLHRYDGRGARSPAFACLCATLVAALFVLLAMAGGSANAETRALKLYNTHTKERATIVFKRNGKYDRAGLAKVNQFLRDWRRNEPTKMDPKLLDLVWEAYQESGATKHIHVISGYRSPATNKALRKRSKGVARNSQHMRGKAMDFYIPGVPVAKLRAIGLRAQIGGVGYYPTSTSPFVHMDTGNVRHWPKMSRRQLAKVFPKGKTIHVPKGRQTVTRIRQGAGCAQAAQSLRQNRHCNLQRRRSNSAQIETECRRARRHCIRFGRHQWRRDRSRARHAAASPAVADQRGQRAAGAGRSTGPDTSHCCVGRACSAAIPAAQSAIFRLCRDRHHRERPTPRAAA